MQQETLVKFQDEFQHFSKGGNISKGRQSLPPPPKELNSALDFKLGGDVGASPIASNSMPVMADVLMSMPDMGMVKPTSAPLKPEPAKQAPAESIAAEPQLALDVQH